MRGRVFSVIWESPWAASALLGLCVFATFWPLLGAGFIALDDPEYVTANPRVQAGLTWGNVRWAFTHVHWFYCPLTWLSHMADWDLYGAWAGGHHLSSVLLHAGSAILLFLFLRRATGMGPGALMAAALFALHPLHVESVAWVAERKDVLSAFFLMVCLLAYDRYARGGSRVAYMGSLGALACGLLAKSTLVMAPVLLVLLDAWPYGRLPDVPGLRLPPVHGPARGSRWMPWLAEKAPFFALAGVFGVLTLVSQGGAVSDPGALPLWARTCNALWNYALFLAKTVAPVNLAVVYPFPPLASLPLKGLVGGALVVLGTTLAFRLRRSHPEGLVGWLWYLIYPATTVGFIQVGVQGATDRTTYVAIIGIFLILSWEAEALSSARPRAKWPLAVAGGGVVLCAALMSHDLARQWRSSETLFEHAARAVPGNAQALTLLAQEALGRGDTARARFLLEEALRAAPALPDAWGTMGNLHAREGRMAEAQAAYQHVLTLCPGDETAWFNLGGVYEAGGNLELAEVSYRKALEARANYLRAHVALSRILLEEGRIDEARREAEAAFRMDPYSPEGQAALAAVDVAAQKRRSAVTKSTAGKGTP